MAGFIIITTIPTQTAQAPFHSRLTSGEIELATSEGTIPHYQSSYTLTFLSLTTRSYRFRQVTYCSFSVST